VGIKYWAVTPESGPHGLAGVVRHIVYLQMIEASPGFFNPKRT
jgi:hypothetical protein